MLLKFSNIFLFVGLFLASISINIATAPFKEKLADENSKEELSFDELMQQFQKINKNSHANSIANNIQTTFTKITKAWTKHSKLYSKVIYSLSSKPMRHKKIQELSGEDIKKWSVYIRKTPKAQNNSSFIPEAIAVIMRANQLSMGQMPRVAQIIALLALLNKQIDQGRVLEVVTGEGKSTICAMLATILALKGKSVDIITSSPVLAERDAKNRIVFFRLFNLTVDHNTNLNNRRESFEREVENQEHYVPLLTQSKASTSEASTTENRHGYSADILYGNLASFQADYLRHEYMDSRERGKRKFENAIVDEADSLLVDGVEHVLTISSPVLGMEYLGGILVAGWQKLQQIFSDHVNVNEKNLNAELINFFESLINQSDKKGLIVPLHLKEYATNQASNWANAAIKALKMEENKDYVLKVNKNEEIVIAVVDYINTGIVEKQTVWQNGLHQFLQLKNNLKLTAESLPSCFISTRAYLKLYKEDIYGLTGTLGSLESQNFIAKVYNFDFLFIPTFKPKLLDTWKTILSTDENEWLKNIKESVLAQINSNRAVLLISLTIEHVNRIQKVFMTQDPKLKIRRYSRNDWIEEKSSVETPIEPGEIILATNLGGRGTDLLASEQLENSNGLHVCVTFLPENSRIEQQAFGRTARQGKRGTAQLILNQEEIGKLYSKKIGIDGLKKFRDLKEKIVLEEYLLYFLPNRKLQDDMAAEFGMLFQELCNKYKKELFDEYTERISISPDKKLSVPEMLQYMKGHIHRATEAINYPKCSQLQELWGFKIQKFQDELRKSTFLKLQKTTRLQTTRNRIKSEFENFKQDVKEAFVKDKHFFRNPSYAIHAAIANMHKLNWELAMTDLNNATTLGPDLALPALNLKAAVILQTGTSIQSYQKAASYLKEARQLIKNKFVPYFERVSSISNAKIESQMGKQILFRKSFFENLDERIKKILGQIEECMEGKCVVMLNYTQYARKEFAKLGFEKELFEFSQFGFSEIFVWKTVQKA